MSTPTISNDTDTIELLDFSVSIPCNHPRHDIEADLHNWDNPAAVALLGRMCPECECYMEYYVCDHFLNGILNGRVLLCLECLMPVIGAETIVKLEYL
jgi:hypothetical protein